MTTIQTDLFRIGHEILQVLRLGDRVLVAIDHECGLLDDWVYVCQQVPVSVKVSVPVDAAREPG